MDESDPSRGVVAYFSLSFKEITLCEDVSGAVKKKLDGFSTQAEQIRVYLLGQVGKHFEVGDELKFPEILQHVLSCVAQAYDLIGGRALLLECEESAKLVTLYTAAGFRRLQKSGDLVQMYYPLKF